MVTETAGQTVRAHDEHCSCDHESSSIGGISISGISSISISSISRISHGNISISLGRICSNICR